MEPFVTRLTALAVIVGVASGCAHTVVVETEPVGARVVVDGEPMGESPVIMQKSTSTGGRMYLEVSAEGYETETVAVTQSEIFLWPMLIALTPALGLGVVWAIPIGPVITLAWAVVTSPTLIALAFMQKYPDRIQVNLRPKLRGGVLQPTDSWLIPDDYDPNPPPLPDDAAPPPDAPRTPQPEGANPVP